MTAYMAAPSGYNVLEHIDDALRPMRLNCPVRPRRKDSAGDLAGDFLADLHRYDWPSFVEWVGHGAARPPSPTSRKAPWSVTMRSPTPRHGNPADFVRQGAALWRTWWQVDTLLSSPIRKFLDADNFKAIVTIFDERPSDAAVSTHRDGHDFDPPCFRGFYVHKDAPRSCGWRGLSARLCQDYQAFND